MQIDAAVAREISRKLKRSSRPVNSKDLVRRHQTELLDVVQGSQWTFWRRMLQCSHQDDHKRCTSDVVTGSALVTALGLSSGLLNAVGRGFLASEVLALGYGFLFVRLALADRFQTEEAR